MNQARRSMTQTSIGVMIGTGNGGYGIRHLPAPLSCCYSAESAVYTNVPPRAAPGIRSPRTIAKFCLGMIGEGATA
jgi:hypothetical protein